MTRFEGATTDSVKGETLSIPQAAVMLEKPEGTVRDWVKKGLIRARLDLRGRWLIERESLVAYASAKARTTTSSRGKPQIKATVAPLDETVSRYIRSLEDSLTREQRLSDELRARNNALQSELLKLTAEIKAILSKEDKSLLSRWIRG